MSLGSAAGEFTSTLPCSPAPLCTLVNVSASCSREGTETETARKQVGYTLGNGKEQASKKVEQERRVDLQVRSFDEAVMLGTARYGLYAPLRELNRGSGGSAGAGGSGGSSSSAGGGSSSAGSASSKGKGSHFSLARSGGNNGGSGKLFEPLLQTHFIQKGNEILRAVAAWQAEARSECAYRLPIILPPCCDGSSCMACTSILRLHHLSSLVSTPLL
jgi:hypothetical protein